MKNRVLSIGVIIITIAAVVILSLYIGNDNARTWIDKNIFRKDLQEEDLPTVELEERKNN